MPVAIQSPRNVDGGDTGLLSCGQTGGMPVLSIIDPIRMHKVQEKYKHPEWAGE